MDNIKIERFTDHPRGALGRIEYGGEDGPWYAVIDAKGLPRVHVRATFEDDAGSVRPTYVCVDDFPPEELRITSLYGAHFEGECSEEDAAAAEAERKAEYQREVEAGFWKVPETAPCA